MTESRDYPARPILCASAAVFREGRILLGARRHPPFDKIFSLPGGLVEPGETLEEAAVREVEEETGVRSEIVAFNGWREIIQHDDDGRVKRHYVIASFVARWVSGEGAPTEELGQVFWSEAADVLDLPLTPGLPDFLTRARDIMNGA